MTARHQHTFKPVGDVWRRQVTKKKPRKPTRYNRSRFDISTHKVGPLLQTFYCSGCLDIHHIAVQP